MRKYQISFTTPTRAKLIPKPPERESGAAEIMARQRAEAHDVDFIESKMAEFGVRRVETPADEIVAAILERMTGFRRDTNIVFEADTEEQAVLIKMFLNTEAPIWPETGQ